MNHPVCGAAVLTRNYMRRRRGNHHCYFGAALIILCEASQNNAASAPTCSSLGFVPSSPRYLWKICEDRRRRKATVEIGSPTSHIAFENEQTIWQHPMCKNSTAGELSANCGTKYVGEPRPSGTDHSATVIWLHGLGDDGARWSTVTRQMQMQWTKFVFPSAPIRRTRLRVRPTAAWFNAKSLSAEEEEEDIQGILEAAAYVNAMVKEELRQGIQQDRIALVGFSMGGAVVLTALLQTSRTLGAVATINSWLPHCAIPAHMRVTPLSHDISSAKTVSPPSPFRASVPIHPAVLAKTPIYMCHGDEDDVIATEWGRESAHRLATVGLNPRFCSNRGVGHSPAPQQILAVADFLRKALPPEEVWQQHERAGGTGTREI